MTDISGTDLNFMHEIKLIFTSQKEEGKTKLLHIIDLFEFPIEMIVPSNCIGLKIFDGDAINCKLLHELYFVIDDDNVEVTKIILSNWKTIGWVEE